MKLIYDIASCPMTSGMRLEDVADLSTEGGKQLLNKIKG